MLLEVVERRQSPAALKVIGVGGAGGNAINRMMEAGLEGVDFIVANTDVQALENSSCPQRLQIGCNVTGGLGSGGDPVLGRRAAEEDEALLAENLRGADMVFITAGMGGGTGTGGSPTIARIARDLGALTVAIVTKPFSFEGRRRLQQAEKGLSELRQYVDTLITVPNERLLEVVEECTPLNDALRVADSILTEATAGISDLITKVGLINLDFADVRSVMHAGGNALMGSGHASGNTRAREAAEAAVSSPLLEDTSIRGAKALLVNVCGGPDMSLHEVREATAIILEATGEDANVILGAVVDSNAGDSFKVTLVATGFNGGEVAQEVEDLVRTTLRDSGTGKEEGLATTEMARQAETALQGEMEETDSGDEKKDAANEELSERGLEEHDNVVPLVWRRNVRGRSDHPVMSSRWQRTLRGLPLDVPTYLRKQMQ